MWITWGFDKYMNLNTFSDGFRILFGNPIRKFVKVSAFISIEPLQMDVHSSGVSVIIVQELMRASIHVSGDNDDVLVS